MMNILDMQMFMNCFCRQIDIYLDLGFGVGLSLNVIDYIYFRGFILAKLAMTDIDAKIKAQGDKIRELKTAKSEKDVIDPEVKILLSLKAEFKVCKQS